MESGRNQTPHLETSDNNDDHGDGHAGSGGGGGGCPDPLPVFPPAFWIIIRDFVAAFRTEINSQHEHRATDFERVAKIMIARIDGPDHNLLLAMGDDCILSLNVENSTATKFQKPNEDDSLGVVFATASPSIYGISYKTDMGFMASVMFDMDTLPHVKRFGQALPLSLRHGV
jgi:hypothetical protein